MTRGCADSCRNRCSANRETARIQCDTDQQLATGACAGDFDVAENMCRVAERTVRETCEDRIPVRVRTCAANTDLDGILCHQKASDRQEDCGRACDPLGGQRCNMHCGDRFYADYGKCIEDDWICYARRSNEGSEKCEVTAQEKSAMCLMQARTCKEQEDNK